ncbi:unnamed protein product [Didymodactylos carnosus]|uniref:Reverse transcriptase domain-containing protein n=1 Tax=Didymodactylos carnosus TaxID=1234261 RepID=A0A815ELT4_9BILA|nr:unnamed protein product [Didymodactylos carnosus]CAF4152666.1 unnamed protein product [Didymodactylos carnosus]
METIKYFNKVNNPALTTSQLRPITLLPVLSKLYEHLFLLKFKKWLEQQNILPPQQAGARKHLSTSSRENLLIEQITQSLRYNSFTPVIYVDFKPAFDMVWQQGLILKLYNLECPYAYLLWITRYFQDNYYH